MGVRTVEIAPASSITHQHIAAIINLRLAARSGPVTILDLGCNTGVMISFLQAALPALRPDCRFEIFGLDVADFGRRADDYFAATRCHLSEKYPDISWKDRLVLTTVGAEYPFTDHTFDFIVSNQVMEHVSDHDFVFGEICRCLKSDGLSINLFPVKEIVWECHAMMPLVHRIKNVETREKVMLGLLKLGFRKHYHRDFHRKHWASFEEFARVYSRTLETDTNYLFVKDIRATARNAGLKSSFEYSKNFFTAKLFSYFGYRPYSYYSAAIIDRLLLPFMKRLSSVTVLLQK